MENDIKYLSIDEKEFTESDFLSDLEDSEEEWQWTINVEAVPKAIDEIWKWLRKLEAEEDEDENVTFFYVSTQRDPNKSGRAYTIRIHTHGELLMKAYYMPLISYYLRAYVRKAPFMFVSLVFDMPKHNRY